MANRTPSSFEKTKLASSLEGIYPKKFNFKEELHSSPEVIKAHLMNLIAAINPKLAQQIIQSPTEAHVLEIIQKQPMTNALLSQHKIYCKYIKTDTIKKSISFFDLVLLCHLSSYGQHASRDTPRTMPPLTGRLP